MAYKSLIIKKVQAAPEGLGKTLGLEALRINFSVLRIAKATGATRQTIYNWFFDGSVAPYYRSAVSEIVDIMKKATTAEHAWRDICARFHLKV